MSAQSAGQTPRARGTSPRGVSLILVMLSMLLLTMLAATIVFTARSETFASYNYKLDTQADYLAKAGIQMAIAWFRSDRYVPVSQGLAGTYYNVTSSGLPYNLYTSNTSPVWCTGASGCPTPCTGGPPCTAGTTVQLIGIPGTGNSNYPNLAGVNVAANFAQDLAGGANATLTADARNSGVVYVNAVLRVYQTVNDGRIPSLTPKAMETWYLTSRAKLNGSQATAEETAVIQPIYVPFFANALYGYCSVDMSGMSGTCTDAYNSAAGAYGANPAGPCDTPNAPNVIDAGAGVGANGGVTLAAGVVVGGDVTIGSNPTLPCAVAGFNGGGVVLGQVVSGPPVAPPPTPPIPGTGQPGPPAYTFPANTLGYDNASSPVTLPQTAGGVTPPPGTYLVPGSPPPPPAPQYSAPCATGVAGMACDGTQANPYLIRKIDISGGAANIVTLVGGADIFHPVYYDIDEISEAGQSAIQARGYIVLNVKTDLKITGQGTSNTAFNNAPETMVINYIGTNTANLGGNGSISAVVIAPNATVELKGGGVGGFMLGSIQANNVLMQGGYPLHYDIQLSNAGGTLGKILTISYNRRKM